jgi:1-pyrroline-4-hydroxy-2-carboxylate deaminase
MHWSGVMPAITTPFDESLHVDHDFMARHASWLLDSGCTGIVALGSLGEATTLAFDEKLAILANLVATVAGRAPVVAAISALSTTEAVALARAAADAGCSGLMVLPPYVYRGDWRETKAHMAAIFAATPLSSMLYNNPVAYGTDFLPEHILELAAEHPNLHAAKESSTDVRRLAGLRALETPVTRPLDLFVGVDDLIVEGIAAGATGWIAGLVNALPVESVALFNLAHDGLTNPASREAAFDLYRWFLPLLRMDTVPKFIQLIKLVQQEFGHGSALVRAPRYELTGAELTAARRIIDDARATRPNL